MKKILLIVGLFAIGGSQVNCSDQVEPNVEQAKLRHKLEAAALSGLIVPGPVLVLLDHILLKLGVRSEKEAHLEVLRAVRLGTLSCLTTIMLPFIYLKILVAQSGIDSDEDGF